MRFLLGVGFAIAAAFTAGGIIHHHPAKAIEARSALPSRSEQLASLEIIKDAYRRSPSGFRLLAKFTIKNTNTHGIKDVEVSCSHIGNSGSIVSRSRRVIYETIRPNSQRAMPEIDFGFIPDQASRISCSITDFGVS